MIHVPLQDAIPHNNSPHCTVYEYPTQSEEISIGVAEIAHRYPDHGYAVNHECIEMGYVLKGSGRLITETKTVTLAVGDVVLIPKGERYYWEGTLTVLLPTTPAWYPAQHKQGLDISIERTSH